jgi:hypothetical protein
LDEILQSIFAFLEANHKYNQKHQERYYQSVVDVHNTARDKVIHLLYRTAGSTPSSRTLQKSLIIGKRGVYAKEKKVQSRV